MSDDQTMMDLIRWAAQFGATVSGVFYTWLAPREDKPVVAPAEEPVTISGVYESCPSKTMGGRQDRCGVFQHPPRCTMDSCAYHKEGD